jgi:DNA-binding NarL/FixJ family response regulator
MRDNLDAPTVRESEVYELLKKRLTNKEIAVKLDISVATVKFHVSNILLKRGLGSRYDITPNGAE